MQRRRSLLPTGGEGSRLAPQRVWHPNRAARPGTPRLPFGGGHVISRLAIGNELDTSNGDCGEQEDMNEASLMQDKFQNEPNKKKYPTNRPHS